MSSFAMSSNSLDAKLIKIGVPQELIQLMPEDQKVDIANNCIEFVDYQIVTSPIEEQNTTYERASMSGNISTTDLTQFVSVLRASNSSDNRERLAIYANFDWQSMPSGAYTDPFGISWSLDWRPVPGTSQMSTYVKWSDSISTFSLFENSSSLAYAGLNGCGWNAKFPSIRAIGPGYTIFAIDFYGYGKIMIESITPGSISGSDILAQNYFHTTGSGSIGLNIGVVSIGYNGSAPAKSQGIYANFNY
ncbi:hypothetical protein JCM19376_30010 [Fusibacter bizertensis]